MTTLKISWIDTEEHKNVTVYFEHAKPFIGKNCEDILRRGEAPFIADIIFGTISVYSKAKIELNSISCEVILPDETHFVLSQEIINAKHNTQNV